MSLFLRFLMQGLPTAAGTNRMMADALQTVYGDHSDERLALHEDSNGETAIFRAGEYGLHLRFAWFVYPARDADPLWAEALMRLANLLLIQSDGDFVLEYNGDSPILKRAQGRLVIDRGFRDRGFPFAELTLPYDVDDLPVV